MNTKQTKQSIIHAVQKADEELIKVDKEKIVDSKDDDYADRIKNAAATKTIDEFHEFDIFKSIDEEENIVKKIKKESRGNNFKGFAEIRSK